MEKIKIFVDTKGLNAWVAMRDEQNGLIEVLINKLKADHISCDVDLLVRFAREGTEEIYMLLTDQAQDEIKRLKIVSEAVKEGMLANIGKAAGKYAYNHLRITKALTVPDIQNLVFKDGTPVIGEEELSLKREELTVYIRTEKQRELYECLTQVSDSLNKLEDFNSRNKLKSVFTWGSLQYLNQYIKYFKNPKYKPSVSESGLGAINPMSGNMICEPDPYAIYFLEEPKPERKSLPKPGSKPETPKSEKPESEPGSGNGNKNDPGKSEIKPGDETKKEGAKS